MGNERRRLDHCCSDFGVRVQAASSGFFQEAFGIAGLVCGYLLAAWQYHRVAEHFAPYLKSMWLGEIVGFLVNFFGDHDFGGHRRADRSLDRERSWA